MAETLGIVDVVWRGQNIDAERQWYTAPEAFLTNRPEMTGGEGGKIELKWVFGECEELLNG